MQAGACLRDGKVNGCDITQVGGDLVSGALILKRLNNRDSLWTRPGQIDISDKVTQAQEIKSWESDCQPKKNVEDSN